MALTSAHVLFLLVSLVAVAAVPTAAGVGPIVGGWKPIEKPNQVKEVVEAAKFAVDEFNKQESRSLIFVTIVKAESQVVAGIKYRITLSATDGKNTPLPAANYKAIVLYKAAEKIPKLVSFEKEIRTH